MLLSAHCLGKRKIRLSALEKICKELNPSYPFEYSFVDQDIANLYKAEQRLGNLVQCFCSAGHCDLVPRTLWFIRLPRRAAYARAWNTQGTWCLGLPACLLVVGYIHASDPYRHSNRSTPGVVRDESMAYRLRLSYHDRLDDFRCCIPIGLNNRVADGEL